MLQDSPKVSVADPTDPNTGKEIEVNLDLAK